MKIKFKIEILQIPSQKNSSFSNKKLNILNQKPIIRVKINKSMPNLIDIDNYKPGMILAAPILNRYGQVLLNAGIELSPSHKRMFITWGIKLITVREENSEDEIVITEELQERAEKMFYSRIEWEPKTNFEKDLVKTGIRKILSTKILFEDDQQ